MFYEIGQVASVLNIFVKPYIWASVKDTLRSQKEAKMSSSQSVIKCK
jgi:hypothetical protein